MLALLPWILIWLSVFAPVAAVAWKLCRFLDMATAAMDAIRYDHDRNFALKGEAEKLLKEAGPLCRILVEKVSREIGKVRP